MNDLNRRLSDSDRISNAIAAVRAALQTAPDLSVAHPPDHPTVFNVSNGSSTQTVLIRSGRYSMDPTLVIIDGSWSADRRSHLRRSIRYTVNPDGSGLNTSGFIARLRTRLHDIAEQKRAYEESLVRNQIARDQRKEREAFAAEQFCRVPVEALRAAGLSVRLEGESFYLSASTPESREAFIKLVEHVWTF